MNDYFDRTRILIAKRQDEEHPMVIACMPESTWEIISIEEWDEWKRNQAQEFFSSDWTSYDYVEAVITIPNETLADLFSSREIPVVVEPADD
jgi:hypothetical protein